MNETLRQEFLLDAIRSGDVVAVLAKLTELHLSEIADLLESQPAKTREILWDLVGPGLKGDVLSHAQDAVRA